MASTKTSNKSRTNQQWIADLSGENGVERQELAYLDLGQYAAACALNMLRKTARNLSAISDLDDSTLRDYALDFAQAMLEKVSADNGALLGQYRGEAAFTSWIAKITNHVVLAELRKSTYRAEIHLAPKEEHEESLDNHPMDIIVWRQGILLGQSRLNPEESTQRKELARAIAGCIEELPEREQTVFWAKVVNGHSGQAIAKTLETSRNAVYILLNTARKRLRACLQAGGFA